LRERLIMDFEIPQEFVNVVRGKGMLFIHPGILEEIAKYIAEKSYIVEVYPTEDGLEVERTPLN
ncbi:MAG: radical SAM protein, partial [Thermoplasmata archaeon]